MTCLCCGIEPAELDRDPRLPLLEVEACWSCRDLIARWTGWQPLSSRRGQRCYWWSRAGITVDLLNPMPVAVAQ